MNQQTYPNLTEVTEKFNQLFVENEFLDSLFYEYSGKLNYKQNYVPTTL